MGDLAMTKESIKRLLKTIEESLAKLDGIAKIPKKEFLRNGSATTQDIAKWNFYVVVQGCLDLGNHLISIKGFDMPERYEDIISILEKEKVIPAKIASSMHGMGGFRNIIAHGYFKINSVLLYSHLKKLDDIRKFIKMANTHLRG